MTTCPRESGRTLSLLILVGCMVWPTCAAYAQQRGSPGYSPNAFTEPRLGEYAYRVAPPGRSKAAQQHLAQDLKLAGDYFAGRGVPRDLAQSMYWYRKAADGGDPSAQIELGYFYYAGLGVARNDAEAARWYQRAAASGSARGKINLASLYLHGEGVRQSSKEAADLLRSAAQNGDGTAEAYLGVLTYLGVGTQADTRAGERWFRAGVKHHSAEAEFDLGTLYSVHPEHAKDLPKAAKLLRAAAELGYVPAKHSLGLLLVNHPDLAQGSDRAVSMLSSAAEAGCWRSSLLLGVLARDGRWKGTNPKDAYRWFRVALLQGGGENQAYLTKQAAILASRLSEEDRGAAEAEAAAWFQAHPNRSLYVVEDGLQHTYFPMAEIVAGRFPELTGEPQEAAFPRDGRSTGSPY